MVRQSSPDRIPQLTPKLKKKGEPKLMANEKQSSKQIKQAILNLRNQIPKEEQEIAGVKVWVYGLTSYELEEWRLLRNDPEAVDNKLSTAKLLQLALRDENGNQVFNANELALIGGLPAKDIEPLARAAMKLSGYGIEAGEAIAKNLQKIPGGDGSSGSPGNTNVQSPKSSDDIPDGS
jgi:hypothetical protein